MVYTGVSKVFAQGNTTGNHSEIHVESVNSAISIYQGSLSIPLAVLTFTPLASLIFYGWVYGYIGEKDYWKVMVLTGLTSITALLLFPFLLTWV